MQKQFLLAYNENEWIPQNLLLRWGGGRIIEKYRYEIHMKTHQQIQEKTLMCEHCDRTFQHIHKGNSCNILANHTQI